MMSRILSQILQRRSAKPQSVGVVSLTSHCHYSSSVKAKIIEIDLSDSVSSSSSSKSNDADEVVSKLEEFMHRIIVQRSTPEWLPFLPGSSFWVPPSTLRYGSRRISDGSEGNPVSSLLDFIGKLHMPLYEEEQLVVPTSRGWPSSSYFIEGNILFHLPELDAEEVTAPVVDDTTVKEVVENLQNEIRSQSDNEEG